MVETRRSRAPPPKRQGRGGDLRDRMTGGPSNSSSSNRNRPQGDSYRPAQQQSGAAPSRSEFTFSSTTQGPQFPTTTGGEHGTRRNYGRGRGGASGASNPRHNMRAGDAAPSGFRGGRRGRGGRGGFRPPAAHERALLQTRDDGTEHFMGVAADTNKFRDLAELSDDEEAGMDMSPADAGADTSDGDDSEGPNKKATRTESTGRADGDSVPKWCNPDPYTVAPPPEETTGKRVDFVKLIRKAKNQVAEEQKDTTNAVAANDDFISFGDDDDDEDAYEPSVGPGAPVPEPQSLQGSLNDVATAGPLESANNRAKRSAESSSLPARPVFASRKRKHTADYDGMKDEWLPQDQFDPAPWALRDDYERLRNEPEKLLHNEICDFHAYVGPTAHDNNVRIDMIRRVQKVIGPRFQDCLGSIQCFGSFPVGLYLPTADMDLVWVTDMFRQGGPPTLKADKKQMWKLANKLRFNQVAADTLVIASARVPIIKFKDVQTGLPVDISFENMGGLFAQSTLSSWIRKYSDDFTHLVALVKQLLEMYNLNDNASGGLGGLSICCLVVFFLHHQQNYENLGQAFVRFLDYYGNKFDYSRDRIEVSPPALKRKGIRGIDGREERRDRLSIQDPNDPKNNISGGSYRADQALQLFSRAHKALTDKMATVHMSSVGNISILESIIGGNYSSYQQQRETMRGIQVQEVYKEVQEPEADDMEFETGSLNGPIVIDD